MTARSVGDTGDDRDLQQNPDEARRELAAVYGWVTEGFETADLRAARAVLGELEARPEARGLRLT